MRLTVVPFSLALLVVLAGCTGTLVEVRSAPATIPQSALAPVEYVHGNTTEVPLSYPVGVGPITRDVTVYVWVSGYSRTVETANGTETAGLLVVSSPNRRLEGQSVNPFAHSSNRELVAQLLDLVVEAGMATGRNVTEVASITETGVDDRTVLGQRTDVVTYTATVRLDTATPPASATSTPVATEATPAGDTTTLVVHLMAVEHGEDVVFALGVHGDGLDEAETVADLMETIEHAETVESDRTG